MRHLRAANMCNREPRRWFAQHGFDWSSFIKHGIPVADVIATGDPLALPVIEAVKKEQHER